MVQKKLSDSALSFFLCWKLEVIVRGVQRVRVLNVDIVFLVICSKAPHDALNLSDFMLPQSSKLCLRQRLLIHFIWSALLRAAYQKFALQQVFGHTVGNFLDRSISKLENHALRSGLLRIREFYTTSEGFHYC